MCQAVYVDESFAGRTITIFSVKVLETEDEGSNQGKFNMSCGDLSNINFEKHEYYFFFLL